MAKDNRVDTIETVLIAHRVQHSTVIADDIGFALGFMTKPHQEPMAVPAPVDVVPAIGNETVGQNGNAAVPAAA